MHSNFILVGSFVDFEAMCAESGAYSKRTSDEKVALHRALQGVDDKDSFLDSALVAAVEAFSDAGIPLSLGDESRNFLRNLRGGKGDRQKCAALHFHILRTYPGRGSQLNETVFGSATIDGIFVAAYEGESSDGEESNHISKRPTPRSETAPFKWPFYVPKSDALGKPAHAGIWLNPHNHHSLPLSGREREKGLLEEFVEQRPDLLICELVAPSGAGKTRLVSEWMKNYIAYEKDSVWDAGFVISRDETPWREWMPSKNTIIVIDYTYNYDSIIDVLIDRFERSSPYKIRVLLLDHIKISDRAPGFSLPNSLSGQISLDHRSKLFFHQSPIVLQPEGDQSRLLRHIIASASDPFSEEKPYSPDDQIVHEAARALMAIGDAANASSAKEWVRRRDSSRHPLFAALIGQMIHQNETPDFSSLSRRDLITYYFSFGRRIPWIDLPESKFAKTLGPWVGCYVSAATLMRGTTKLEILDEMPTDVGEAIDGNIDGLIGYCNWVVSDADQDAVKAFEPDILGEAFLIRFLEEFGADSNMLKQLASFIGAQNATPRGIEVAFNFLETLQRLIRNLINDDQEEPAVKAAWTALLRFLNPKWFPDGSLIKQAVSIALGDLIKQCRNAGVHIRYSDLSSRIDINDLRQACSGPLFREATISAIHYYELISTEEPHKKIALAALMEVLIVFDGRIKNAPSFMFPVFEGCPNATKIIFQLSVSGVDVRLSDGSTPLMSAALLGHVDIVAWLLDQGAEPDAKSEIGGWTALSLAVAEGHLSVVEILGSQQAGLEERNDYGMTPLLVACNKGQHQVLRHLQAVGANLHAKTPDGKTALMLSSRNGHLEIVEYLLEAGFDVLSRTNDGATALTVACGQGHLHVVMTFLARQRAKIEAAQQDMEHAMLAAIYNDHLPVVEFLFDKLFRDKPYAPTIAEAGYMNAIMDDHLDIALYFLANGADVDTITPDGVTALMLAAMEGHLEVVKFLIDRDVDIDAVTPEGRTALMFASENGNCAVAEFLILKGADFTAATSDGMTASELARKNGHNDMLDLFVNMSSVITHNIHFRSAKS